MWNLIPKDESQVLLFNICFNQGYKLVLSPRGIYVSSWVHTHQVVYQVFVLSFSL
jgi:hypothetical protein